MGWIPAEANLILYRYQNVYSSELGLRRHAYTNLFYPGQYRIEYGTIRPTAIGVDHEILHAWYEYNKKDSPESIENDFRIMCNLGLIRACDVINSAPIDGVIHWMHYLINYVGRDKMKIPEPYRTRYYGWMTDIPKQTEKRYTIRIPLSTGRTR